MSREVTKKIKAMRLELGQTFVVPLLDGSFVLGQVAFLTYVTRTLPWVATAFFDHRSTNRAALESIAANPNNLQHPAFVLMPDSDQLRHGLWPVIGKQPVNYTNFDVSRRVDVNSCDGESASSGMYVNYLEMYWGIYPWDYYGAGTLERRLLAGFQVPPYPARARFRKDFSEEELARLEDRDVARARRIAWQTTRERGSRTTIHVQYPYDGAGLPSVLELRRRHALETKLSERGAGRIIDAGGGGGAMDVYLSTSDAQKSRATIGSVLSDLGISNATITVE